MEYYCNKCNKKISELNELENEEFEKEKSFVCSDCINEEMEKEKEQMTLMNEHNLKELLSVVFSIMTKEQLKEVDARMSMMKGDLDAL